ncbi:breast carcinoma-amplified sequence 1 isoform X10 [Dicentrarchus labrax]|uniref:breast carcinoma-amplified sequence 1 isoform X10 n=1 Tax=Dicentrarchus labrax TaxID=13489 RepID=UPI0021F69597|nr:breast carcinoma-amplified sequence 1 isoform X10 [Dicentrarchus labrax]
MGNENSKSKELTQNGKIPEKHENGSVNGITESITSNGLEIGINGETVVQKNGGPLNLNLATESTEREYVIVESDSKHVDAPVITEILEADVQKEEVKKSKGEKAPLFGKMFKKKAEPPADVESVKENETSNEDQTDVSVPATDAQPESGSSGDKAATVIIAEQQKAEISTQTERKTETDISTQTGYDDDVTTTNTQCPVEEVFVMEAAATEEDLLNESAVVIAEEVVEETANEEPLDNQTSGIISEEVFIMETSVYENLVFRAERVEVIDNFEISYIKNCVPGGENVKETEPEIAAEPECDPNKSIIDGGVVAEKTVPLEVHFSLPKVVADCIEVVFTTVPESTDFVAVNTPDPSVDKVITEDHSEGARDMSPDVVLIETAKPESNAVTPEARETHGIPFLDKKPVTVVMETISVHVHEEPNPTPAYQDMPVEEPFCPSCDRSYSQGGICP